MNQSATPPDLPGPRTCSSPEILTRNTVNTGDHTLAALLRHDGVWLFITIRSTTSKKKKSAEIHPFCLAPSEWSRSSPRHALLQRSEGHLLAGTWHSCSTISNLRHRASSCLRPPHLPQSQGSSTREQDKGKATRSGQGMPKSQHTIHSLIMHNVGPAGTDIWYRKRIQ